MYSSPPAWRPESAGASSETRSSSNGEARPTVLEVRGLAKCYRLYERPEDRLLQMMWRRRRYYREFWALHPLSFTVARGEAMAIIGRNGSGKSTLLQLIAGTLQATTGSVTLGGRVFPLLELGAGFNPEFTGRENVFLSGALLGVGRGEMQARLGDVVAFADIGEFIDQPVKTYSTGMYARLAFAVATAVDPDVLLVDEILAVGDAAFQHKCVSWMREKRERGLTLLFVSHSVDAVKSVCGRALLLESGRLLASGSADEVTDLYLNRVRDDLNARTAGALGLAPADGANGSPGGGRRRYGTGHVRIENVALEDRDGRQAHVFMFGEEITLRVAYRALVDVDHLSVSFLVRDATGVDLMGTTTFEEGVPIRPLGEGEQNAVRIRFRNRLHPGSYGVSVALNRVTRRDLTDNVLFDQIDAVVAFEVLGDSGRPVHYKFHEPVEVLDG